MPGTWTGLRERLRAQTQPLHDALEAAVAIERQIGSRQRYAGYLTRLWEAHRVIESDLCARDFRPLGFDYSRRQRSHLLAHDLEALGVRGALASRPVLKFVPLHTLEAALGAVYVIEGSAIGARAILPQITKSLGVTATSGASFFAGSRREDQECWQATVAALARIDAHGADGDAVVAGALATFDWFQQHLTEPVTGPTACHGSGIDLSGRPAGA